jgi:hypothetical protein
MLAVVGELTGSLLSYLATFIMKHQHEQLSDGHKHEM